MAMRGAFWKKARAYIPKRTPRDECEHHVRYPQKVKDPKHFAREPFRKAALVAG